MQRIIAGCWATEQPSNPRRDVPHLSVMEKESLNVKK